MLHEAVLVYEPALLQAAARANWRRSQGPGFVVAVLATALIWAWLVAAGDRSWLVGFIGAGLFAGLVFSALAFWLPYRHSLKRLRSMAEATARLKAEEKSFTLSSSLGSSTLAWEAVTAILKRPAFWLLYFSRDQYVAIPLANVPSAMQAFIHSQVASAGGRLQR